MKFSSRDSLSAALSTLLLLTSCTTPQQEVLKNAEQLGSYQVATISKMGNLEARPLSWRQAHKMVMQNNLELQQARDDLKRADEQVKRVFLDLLPSLNLTTSLRKGLTELGQVGSDDLSLDVFSFINVPGIVNLHIRHYTAVLSRLRSEWLLQLKERELTARLYEHFVEYGNFVRRREQLNRSELWNTPSSLQESLLSSPESIERQQQLFNIGLEENAMQERIAELTGSYDHRWQPKASGLPKLNYSNRSLDLADLERAGVLVRQIQAVELVGARLRLQGAKLQYWPDLSTTLSSPPIYSYRNGDSSGWSIDDVVVSAYVPLRIDTQLRTAYQVRDAERQLSMTHKRMEAEIARQTQNYLLAKEELALINKEIEITSLRLDAANEAQGGLSLDDWRTNLRNNTLLSSQLANLRLRQARIETMFWILDETQWPSS